MHSLYNVNGLMFWNEKEIRLRRQFANHFSSSIKDMLLEMNTAWQFIEVETPILTPQNLVNENYTNNDIWVQENLNLSDTTLVLRPETTPGSYHYACHLLNSNSGIKPPFVIWQIGKSFRREQDQVTKNMRLKEFYQQEFQCIFTSDTLNDYHSNCLEPVRRMIAEMIALPTRIIESDRLPSYSLATMDIEVNNGDKWMEVVSISKRTDFPQTAKFQAKNKIVEKELLVLEIAIGLDRCVYNFFQRNIDLSVQD